MRSLVDQADEEDDFREDATQRDSLAAALTQRACEARDALRRLGEQRALRAIRRELDNADEPHLSQYHDSTRAILELVGSLLDDSHQSEAAGCATSSSAPAPFQLPLAEKLLAATRQHAARDEDTFKLSDLASAQVGRLSVLASKPALYAHVEAEMAQAEAAAANSVDLGDVDGGGGGGERSDGDGGERGEGGGDGGDGSGGGVGAEQQEVDALVDPSLTASQQDEVDAQLDAPPLVEDVPE